MFKNDERYWDINLLNKWFAISATIFFVCIVWVFIDDNDDEFKTYQKEFRKLQIGVTKDRLEEELDLVKEERVVFEDNLKLAEKDLNNRSYEIDEIEKNLKNLNASFYDANLEYQGFKAKVDEMRYKVETENTYGAAENSIVKSDYSKGLEDLNKLKLIKEDYEIDIANNQKGLKGLKSELKKRNDERDAILKQVTIVNNKLTTLDRSRMSFLNQVGDIVRDLPILDFLDPYYKVKQTVVQDIHYDVNFATMPVVDRCVSCHLGISNPDFIEAEQPYTTHPNLDLYLTSASPHPEASFGCTSCHAGRSRGTTFLSSAHTPQSTKQKHEWEEKYDWEKIHHWLQPMLPTKYTEASCFKCHMNTSDLAGAEKINFGLTLVDKAGCNGCHVSANWPALSKVGPDLRKINEKLKPDWVSKWIKNPKAFRYNTRMPHIFEQENQESPRVANRNITEIAAITSYLFEDKEPVRNSNPSRYLGDPNNGQNLYNVLGCKGCHIKESDPLLAPEPVNYMNLTKYQGPNLIGMGSKVTPKWLYEWLKNPHEYMPNTRMPNLRLSDQEAKDITAFLYDNKIYDFDQLSAPSADPEVLDELTLDWLKKMNPEKFAIEKLGKMTTSDKMSFIGAKSIKHYGCYGCHNIDGFMDAKPIGVEITQEGSKPVGKFDFGLYHDIEHTNYSWIENKLRTPRIYDRGKESEPLDLLRMPNFYFTEEEIEAITTAVLAFNADKVGEPLLAYKKFPKENKEGHRLVKNYNCQGCHLIQNRGGQLVVEMGAPEYAPPNLHSEGRKANPDWLLSFLNNPKTIRPNLQVRMPSYHQISDKEWDTIIRYFQNIDDNKTVYAPDYIADKSGTKFHAGEKVHEIGACNSCHFYGEEFPTGVPATWAPNLALTKERLNPDWVVEWLRAPQELMPGTKMPAPYLPDEEILEAEGAEKVWGKDLISLKGNQEAMLEGLRDYLWNVDGKSDISDIVKEYFDENGFNFSSNNNSDIDNDDDDWDDDEDEEDEDW